MTTSAQGKDFSAYQPPITAADVAGLDFCFTKATNGTEGTDPTFENNWGVIRAAGIICGAYHELTPGDPAGQAQHFLATVRAQGLQPGHMLAVSVSDYPDSAGEALAFLSAVKLSTQGRNPSICYTDLSVARGLGNCTGYPLWIAWPATDAPASVDPWDRWTIWQWRMTGQDQDSFNGTPQEMADSERRPHPEPSRAEAGRRGQARRLLPRP